MLTKDQETILNVYLEEYRMLSGELLLYVKEMIKCFVFLAILVGVYLGLGISGGERDVDFLEKVRQYLPYGVPVLALYFLVLAYIRIGLSIRRSVIETCVNQLLGSEILGFEAFAQRIQSRGFIIIGSSWYKRVPTPMLFLGFLIFFGALLIFGTGDVAYKGGLFFYSVLACGIFALYVFFVFPSLAKKAQKRIDAMGSDAK